MTAMSSSVMPFFGAGFGTMAFGGASGQNFGTIAPMAFTENMSKIKKPNTILMPKIMRTKLS